MSDVQPGDEGQVPADDRATDDAVQGDQETGVAGEPVGADDDQEEALVDAVAAEDEDDPAAAEDPDPADEPAGEQNAG
jgi:hypothetical protein